MLFKREFPIEASDWCCLLSIIFGIFFKFDEYFNAVFTMLMKVGLDLIN